MVIIKHMTMYYNSKPNIVITYFYFNFNELRKQNAINFVSSLIAKLYNHLAELPEELTPLHKISNSCTQVVAFHSFQGVLYIVTKKLDTVFIVANTLDECPNNGTLQSDLLDLIVDMSIQSSSNLHLLVSHRS